MTKLRFLISLITKDNDYQMEQASAANAGAAELGVDAQIVYADNDPITQSTQVLKAIQSDPSLRPNGIVVEPHPGPADRRASSARRVRAPYSGAFCEFGFARASHRIARIARAQRASHQLARAVDGGKRVPERVLLDALDGGAKGAR